MIPVGTHWTVDGSRFVVRARGRAVELASGALALARFASEARFHEWCEDPSSNAPEFASTYARERAERAVRALQDAAPVQAKRAYSDAEKCEVLEAYVAGGRRDRAGVASKFGFSEGALARLISERNRTSA